MGGKPTLALGISLDAMTNSIRGCGSKRIFSREIPAQQNCHAITGSIFGLFFLTVQIRFTVHPDFRFSRPVCWRSTFLNHHRRKLPNLDFFFCVNTHVVMGHREAKLAKVVYLQSSAVAQKCPAILSFLFSPI